ncbi:2-oxoacid dehydrogenase/acyltransferase catalytic subunit [Cecembia rubra]|uniref:2-oxoacid dehydrogenase/acyltransferase catalytic subunit n=2 Tax=Cecembia rubra TaxID=1485585 RepID=A0A2P8ED28_9BACT|nr:2-oxoacid dehydrogenase/acyltransferase catalytic subunit [Cecembia rubra]
MFFLIFWYFDIIKLHSTMSKYRIQQFPDSRLATMDICEIGKQKHHVTGLIELDVSESRKKIAEYNKVHQEQISFSAWLLAVIAQTLQKHDRASSYLIGKNKQIIFEDINISILVEKEINGSKVPIPLLLEKAQELSIEAISKLIQDAKLKPLTDKDIVLHRKRQKSERLYYKLPGFLRRLFWRYLLNTPKLAFQKMGNVSFTSLGMMGDVKGWFIPISIHPVCFGVSSTVKQPVVYNDQIIIREILKMSILMDHDVMDGAPMARFIAELSKNIERGLNLYG